MRMNRTSSLLLLSPNNVQTNNKNLFDIKERGKSHHHWLLLINNMSFLIVRQNWIYHLLEKEKSLFPPICCQWKFCVFNSCLEMINEANEFNQTWRKWNAIQSFTYKQHRFVMDSNVFVYVHDDNVEIDLLDKRTNVDEENDWFEE